MVHHGGVAVHIRVRICLSLSRAFSDHRRRPGEEVPRLCVHGLFSALRELLFRDRRPTGRGVVGRDWVGGVNSSHRRRVPVRHTGNAGHTDWWYASVIYSS